MYLFQSNFNSNYIKGFVYTSDQNYVCFQTLNSSGLAALLFQTLAMVWKDYFQPFAYTIWVFILLWGIITKSATEHTITKTEKITPIPLYLAHSLTGSTLQGQLPNRITSNWRYKRQYILASQITLDDTQFP